MELNVRDKIFIQSYKHDGSLHRTWAKGFVVDTNQDRSIIVTNQTIVTEADGRRWNTREPALCFFYPDRWYNVICMIRKTGVFYYCNLASPFVVDQEALKNIDYDLDVKVYPNGDYQVLDEDEYRIHSMVMQYPKAIRDIIEETLQKLLIDIEQHHSPFNAEEVYHWYRVYQTLISK
jgi:uncharacterized protein